MINKMKHNPAGRESKLVVSLYNGEERINGKIRILHGLYMAVRYVWNFEAQEWCQANVIKKFGNDEKACRAYVELWNGADFVGGPGWEP